MKRFFFLSLFIGFAFFVFGEKNSFYIRGVYQSGGWVGVYYKGQEYLPDRLSLEVGEKTLSRAPVTGAFGRFSDSFYLGYAGIPPDFVGGVLTAKVYSKEDDLLYQQKVYLSVRNFISEEIALDKSMSDLRTSKDNKKAEESRALWALLVSYRDAIEIPQMPFIAPLDSRTRRSSFFGDRRVYLYTGGGRGQALHNGIDYAVPEGTEIYSSSSGEVVFAGERIVTGYTVIVEAAPGVYVLYYHLSKLKCSEGDKIGQGELIGLSGSTGLSTGPHLHFEIRMHGVPVDPDLLMSNTILDRPLIWSLFYAQKQLVYSTAEEIILFEENL